MENIRWVISNVVEEWGIIEAVVLSTYPWTNRVLAGMPSKLTAHKLNGPAKDLVTQLLAEFARPTEVQEAVKQAFGINITLPAIIWYQRSPKWSKVIEAKRQALDANVDRLPISSRYWRMKERGSLLRQARTQGKPDLGTARGLLTDAARELGELQPEESGTPHIGSINLTLVAQVLQLPEHVQEQYLRTGILPPASYLSDLPVVEDEKDGNLPG